MRLSAFILRNMETIVTEWEEFAATLLPAAAGLSSLSLRDHAQQILEAIARDLTTDQTREAQAEKSKGRAPQLASAPETAAHAHALLRARGGFDINQLIAEYRALRASVLRLWMDGGPSAPALADDIIRFNEAIDQAVAESVGHFHAQMELARNLLLGMLGHDMRSPLATIRVTASHLAALNAGEKVSVAAARLIRSGASMQALLDDLMDFSRTNLGVGIRVVAAEIDLGTIVTDELEQLRGAHPQRCIELAVSGNTLGCWDSARLQQLLRNLTSNALSYGAHDAPVCVALRGEEASVLIEVTNRGPELDTATLRTLFDPLTRGPTQGDEHGSLGLGLFIVREIARAHGGDVEVRSAQGETTFAVRLPR